MAQPRVVGRNDWHHLAPRAVGRRPRRPLDVSVVVPAHDGQDELDLCMAGLQAQSYPQGSLEVIVVDDRSDPPLRLPELCPRRARIVRNDDRGEGSGHARDLGARDAAGEVILFLDADIIADRDHVDAHVRWHEVAKDAVVLGFKDFADTGAITPGMVEDVVRRSGSRMVDLVRDRPIEPHLWIEAFLTSTDDLRTDAEHLWRPVVGASVSVRRDFYRETGGFSHFPHRGIVDTEFGYRCYQMGGLIVPERAATSLHQGARSFSLRGAELARLRKPLIANYIAFPRYRPPLRGRQWAVPYVHAVVPRGEGGFDAVRATVDDLLASTFDDVRVTVVTGPDDPAYGLLWDYFHAEGRVDLREQAPTSGFPSPLSLIVPPGTRFARPAVERLVARMRSWDIGCLVIAVEGAEAPVELWQTRALNRLRRAVGSISPEEVRRSFGVEYASGRDQGVRADPVQTVS